MKVFFVQNEHLNKYLENYFTEVTGKKCYITCDFSPTSSIRLGTYKHTIGISLFNLFELYEKAPKYYRKLYYTLLSHEFGHAIYTGNDLQVTPIRNVIEDMRLEYQIQKVNIKTRFDIMRYIFQDQRNSPDKINSVATLALVLFRTMNNKKYLKYLHKLGIDTKEVMELAQQYKFMDNQLGLSKNGLKEVKELGDEIEKKLKEMFWKKEELEKERDEKEANGEGEGEETDEEKEANGEGEGEETDEEKETNGEGEEIETQGNSKETKPTAEEETEDISDDETLEEMFQKELERFEGNPNLSEPEGKRLKNPITTNYKPPFIKISLTDTIRRSGIKGDKDKKTMMGGPKNFNMRRYSTRKFTKERKHFDTRDYKSKGGKTADLVIYLDVSGSMWGGSDKPRYQIAVEYLANLYDQTKKHLNIKMRIFGRENCIITRNELDPNFIRDNLQDYTILLPEKIKKNEMHIVITDGDFSNHDAINQNFKNKAHFVIIDSHPHLEAKHKYYIDSENLKQTLDNLTKKLRRHLSC